MKGPESRTWILGLCIKDSFEEEGILLNLDFTLTPYALRLLGRAHLITT